MVISYLKTSCRHILRDKLFSAITIFGLAISLSVGLLMVSLLTDLSAYDRFHQQADRIYRVITTRQHGQTSPRQYASASVRAGRSIRQMIPGIDHVTLLQEGFQEDIRQGEHALPLQGFWADESFFKVFTFDLIEGDALTALQEPYSIILTESAAEKLFQGKKAMGQSVLIEDVSYQVRGIAKNVPMFSHLRFEVLVSLATKELQERENEEWDSWTRISGNYIYLMVSEKANPETIQDGLDKLSDQQNLNYPDVRITLALEPLKSFVSGKALGNPIGPVIPAMVIWILGGLSIVVILCACFNYTSLSVARYLRRAREIGIRKVNGARKVDVFFQFLIEAVFVAILSMVFSFLIFILLRPYVLSLHPHLGSLVSLSITAKLICYFIILAIAVGLLAGMLPALLFTRVNPLQSLKNLPSIKMFPPINLRKGLIAIQYTFSLLFMGITLLGNRQYRHFISFDVGFKTDQIVNIDLQGNNPDLLVTELKKIPEVISISRSASIISLDSYSKTLATYGTPPHSQEIDYNVVDANYLSLHGFTFVAGNNFSEDVYQKSVIVNEQFLNSFHLDPEAPFTLLGNKVRVNGEDHQITGVVKDFYYGGAERMIGPYLFIYSNKTNGFVSVKVQSESKGVWSKLENAWRVIDPVHPMEAAYYWDQMERGYEDIASMLKIIGFLSLLTLSIASLGLLGMVVFTTESRIKEIGIRKVMGASARNLIYLLSKEFLLLLSIPLLLALPAVVLFFERVVFPNYAYHAPVSIVVLVTSMVMVLGIAWLMIGFQTWKIAHRNPVLSLRNE